MASTDVREDMGDTAIATQPDGGECGRMSIPRFESELESDCGDVAQYFVGAEATGNARAYLSISNLSTATSTIKSVRYIRCEVTSGVVSMQAYMSVTGEG